MAQHYVQVVFVGGGGGLGRHREIASNYGNGAKIIIKLAVPSISFVHVKIVHLVIITFWVELYSFCVFNHHPPPLYLPFYSPVAPQSLSMPITYYSFVIMQRPRIYQQRERIIFFY